MYKVIVSNADYVNISKALEEINGLGAVIENTFNANSRVFFIVKVSEKTEKSNRKKGDE